jgi:predicted enzyme related to lactoylglutathione lyase
MSIKIEHINVTLNNIDAAAQTLKSIFGWHIRWEGSALDDGRTIHIGDENSYLALYTHNERTRERTSHRTVGHLNHIGIVVEDLDDVENKIKRAGFDTFNHGDYEPGRRFYFNLEPEVEIEVVSYAS